MMNRENKIVATSVVGIAGNVLLAAGKAIIGFISGSISILSDAINNFSDVLSSVITIVGTKLAGKKPDKKHPFGHGRIEYITSLIISLVIMFAGANAIYESIRSLIEGEDATYDITSLIIISVAIIVKILLGLLYRIMAKQTKSDALKSSGTDALFDALLSSTTLVGALISMYAGVSIEGYLGILIGLFIIKTAIDILRGAISSIIGERADKELAKEIKQEALKHKEVIGVYDLILNNYGPNRSIGSFHIEVKDNMTASQIHPLTKEITKDIFLKYGVIITIGIYANNSSHPEIMKMRKYLYDEIKKYEDIKEIHGFFVDTKEKTISFDLLFEFSAQNLQEERDEIIKKLKEKYPDYTSNIIIDFDFSD